MGIKVGVVIHGPGIVDSGYGERILHILREFSEDIEITAKVGGNMGRVAVIDRGLEDLIDISERLYPSQCLRRLRDRDILVLLNYGKSRETGHTFGRIVVERGEVNKPVIQIERPGEKDGSILVWNRGSCSGSIREFLDNLLSYLSEKLDLKVEECIGNSLSVWKEGGRTFRRIDTVDPGEAIIVNGVVVGMALGSPVVLIVERGRIVEIVRGKIKRDGVERLGPVDLGSAIVKTGLLRRGSFRGNAPYVLSSDPLGDVLIVDRGDIDILKELKNGDVSTVVTIGSDTTSILSGILSRFNVKIVGIADKDIFNYKLVEDLKITEGSRIFLVENCECYQVGKLLMEHLKGRRLSYQETLRDIVHLLEKYRIVYKVYEHL